MKNYTTYYKDTSFGENTQSHQAKKSEEVWKKFPRTFL